MISFTGAKRWRITMAMLLTLSMVLVLLPVNQVSAADMTHQVTNVGANSLTISWISQNAEQGHVNYGINADDLSNTAYDDRGQTTEDDTHHVIIIGLTAGTTYYYEIVSGGVTYNNGGVPYEITTGPTISGPPPMPKIIGGKVYKTDGVTAAEGTIIYVSIGTSQVWSGLIDDSGTWALDIGPIRTADYQSYLTYFDTDDISLEAQGGADGTATQTVTVAVALIEAGGAPDMILAVTPIADFSVDVTVTEVDEEVAASPALSAPTASVTSDLSATPEKVNIEQTVEEAAPEPTKEMKWWLVGGILAGVIVLVTTIWLTINKYRY